MRKVINSNFLSLVSIIIPIYNSELYLRKCLDSVVKQTYSNLEIILINDGSTDLSKEIIEEYAAHDNRIVVVHKPNGGIGSAYKVALNLVKGDFVFFLDSDDWIELNAIEVLLSIAVSYNVDMVVCGIQEHNINGEQIYSGNFKLYECICNSNEEIQKTHFLEFKHPTLSRLIKSNLLNDLTIFDQNIGIDEMITPQLIARSIKMAYSSTILIHLLIRDNSISRNKYSEEKIIQTLTVYEFLEESLAKLFPIFADELYYKYMIFTFNINKDIFFKKVKLTRNLTKQLKNKYLFTYSYIRKSKLYKEIPLVLKMKMWAMTLSFRI